MELVLENGQILIRGPSGRTDQWSAFMVQKKIGEDTIFTEIARVGTFDQSKSSFNNDKIDSDCHNHDGQPEFLPELCEANPNAPFKHYNNTSKIIGEDSQPTGHRIQASHPQVVSKNSSQDLVSVGGLHNSKIQEDSVHSKKMGLMNFSHFLRPAKANTQSTTDAPRISTKGSSRARKMRSSSDKMEFEDFSNPSGYLTLMNSGGSENVIGLQNQEAQMVPEVGFRPLVTETPEKPLSHHQSKALSHDQAPSKSLSFAESAIKGKPKTVRSIDALAASSSVRSRGVSNNRAYTLKRKYQETESSSSYYSDDDEEEPEGVKKPLPARGSSTDGKRNRSSEMHNLSERRRRNKISQKMRALQELIPDCNKVDKVSMLDEAIEYLKILQLQVQIMSMRSRFYMTPMMLPSTQFTHYSPMDIRLGFGMGIGSSLSGDTAMPGFEGFQFPRPVVPDRVPFTTMPTDY